jgi:subtilisin family serine protease
VPKTTTQWIWILLSACVFSSVSAQHSPVDPDLVQTTSLPTFYIYEGAPVELSLDPTRIAVKTSGSSQKSRSLSSASQTAYEIVSTVEVGVEGWLLAKSRQASADPIEANSLLDRMLASPEVEFASPILLNRDGSWMAVTQDILVRFKPEFYKNSRAVLASAISDYEVLEADFGGMAGAFRLKSNLRNGFAVLALANQLAMDPRFQWAEPDMIATVKKDMTPNDPGWNSLWGLRNVGQSSGTVDMDMDCDSAWDISIGDPDIKVLILDDGIQMNHPDLNIAGGADFTGQQTGGDHYNVCDGHGTSVAGCVSAIVNNSLGTIGAAPGCRVLAARFSISNVPCDGSGTYFFSAVVSALNWGQQQGARVSNNSNGLAVSSSVTAKYQDTYAAGMVHFAAAGNDGNQTISYPASLSSVNAVSAITRYGTKASFSSYGSGLSLAAPGQSIYTTDRTGGYGFETGDYATVDGTSFSSPYAAAVAALLISVDPWLTPAEVETQLQSTAMDLGTPGFDIYYGHGLVNALGAIAHARLDILSDVVLGPAPLSVNFTGSTARPAISWSWDFGDGGGSLEQNPQHDFLEPGLYTVTTSIETAEHSFSRTVPDMIAVYADTLVFGNGRLHSQIARVDLDAHNTLSLKQVVVPFIYQGPISLRFDSVTVTGLRSSSMTVRISSLDDTEKKAAFVLSTGSGSYLEAGTGPIASLWFRSLQPGVLGTVPIDTASNYQYPLSFSAANGSYQPVSVGGSVVASCCQGVVGNADGQGIYPDEVTLGDIMLMVDAKFVSGDCSKLPCVAEADVNQDGGLNPNCDDHVTLSDIMALVDYLFITGPQNMTLPNCL